MGFPQVEILNLDGTTSYQNVLPNSGQNVKGESLSVTLASDTDDLEPAGVPVTGVTLPAGGHGIKGWLSYIASNQTVFTGAAGASPPALATNASGVLGWARKITDVLSGVLTIATTADVATTATPVAGSVSDTVAHTSTAYVPQYGRQLWLEIDATNATGSVQLVRSTDGGATHQPITFNAFSGAAQNLSATTQTDLAYTWNLTGFSGQVINEPTFTATDGSTYSLLITLTSGQVNYRINQ